MGTLNEIDTDLHKRFIITLNLIQNLKKYIVHLLKIYINIFPK